jgi:hypothetical protein
MGNIADRLQQDPLTPRTYREKKDWRPNRSGPGFGLDFVTSNMGGC